MEFEGAAYAELYQKQAEWVAEQAAAAGGRKRRQTTPYNPSKNTCGVALIADKRFMDAHFLTNGADPATLSPKLCARESDHGGCL